MAGRTACVGSTTSTEPFEAVLRGEGFDIESADTDRGLDVAVFLDDAHRETGAVALARDGWLDAAIGALTTAFAFARATAPKLERRSGVFAVVTTLAGDLGVPGRSLDAAIGAGIDGLVRSVVHEAPGISAVRIGLSTPTPVPTTVSADVPWPTTMPDADGAVARDRIVTFLSWLVAGPRTPGSVVMLTSTPIA